jgi:glycerol-3-phosphate acyltransferase PlsY
MHWLLMGGALLLGYVCGSISFARIIVRLAGHDRVQPVDLTSPDGGARLQSDAVSATAVRLQLGARWGLTCAAGDILKAFVPVLVLRIVFPGEPYLYAAALGALIGHNWPVFHRFKGGRGQSPMLGGMLAIAPLGAIVCSVAGFVLGYYVIRDAMTSDNLGQLFYIPWVWVAGLGPWAIAWALTANIIFFGSYAGEIRQYAAGRIGGHLRDPDDVMRMMRMDYEWMPRASRRTPIDDTSSDESR